MAPRVELFAFRYCDPRAGKWVRARYVATRQEIAKRHAEWEIAGPAEIRDVDSEARSFTPHWAPPIGNLEPLIAIASSSRRVQVIGVAR